VVEDLPSWWRVGDVWLARSPINWLGGVAEKLRICRRRRVDEVFRYDRILPKVEAEEIARFAEKSGFDAVFADYVWCAPFFEMIASRAVRKGIIAHDIMVKRRRSLIRSGVSSDVSEEVVERERELLGLADFVCVETLDDEVYVRENVCGVITFCMPRAIAVKCGDRRAVEKIVMFVGGGAPHNLQGIMWFVEEVWPLVLAGAKDATLCVLGAVADKIYGVFPNVELVGRVEDLGEYYRRSAVCIVPLLSGSGFKTKLIEALAYGRACVSTPVGAVGVRQSDDEPLIIAGDAEEFGEAVLKLLSDERLRRDFECRACDYIDMFHSPRAIYSPILRYLDGAAVD
jgi:glycosyltransferase involved in cell wall biosynthesis